MEAHLIAHGYYERHRAIAVAFLFSTLALFTFAGEARADHSNSGSGKGIAVAGIQLAADGAVNVHGAKVTAVSGTDVNANTSWGSAILNWVVKTDSNTSITDKGEKKNGLVTIVVGDIINFTGSLDQSANTLVVHAKTVKDTSAVKARTALSGTVTSINTTLNSFTVSSGNATTSVQTSSTTKIKVNGNDSSFGNIFLNAKVKIAGLFNSSTSIFSATSVDVSSTTNKRGEKSDHDWKSWIHSNVWLKFWNR